MTQNQIDSAVEKSPRGRNRLDGRILLLALAMSATGTDALVLIGILPLVAADLGIDPGTVGELLTAYMITFALSSPVLTALFANRRHDRIIVVSLFLFATMALGSALAPSFTVLLVMRIIAACCSATYSPVAFLAAAVLSPAERRGAGIAAGTLGLIGAQLVGIPIATWVGETFGWRTAFAFDAALVLATAAALAMWPAPARLTGSPPRFRDRFAPLRKPNIMLAIVPVAFWSNGFSVAYTWCAVLLGPKIGSENIPALLLSAGAGGLIGSQFGGRVGDRFGPSVPIIGCICVNALNLAALNLTAVNFSSAAAAMFVLSFCSWGLFAPQRSRLFAIDPAHGVLALAINNSVSYLGVGAGTAIGAAFISHQWLAALPYAGAISYLAALGFFLASVSNTIAA